MKEKCDKLKSNGQVTEPLPSDLQEAINNIIKEEGYETYKVESKLFPTDGGSYLGSLHEINIIGKTNKGDKETNLFIKRIIPGGNETIMSVEVAYLKEAQFYNEIVKIYEELQDEANVPKQERLKVVKSYDVTNDHLIVLDNMVKKRYKTFSRMGIIPLKFAELAFEQISKFHGMTFVIQKKKPDYFNNKMKNSKPHFMFNDEFDKFVEKQCNTSVQNLDNFYKEKVQAFLPKFLTKFRSYYDDYLPGSTIIHGDYRASNVVIKEENGDIISLIPVDFQLTCYGCPLFDLFYMLFTSSDREFRRNHMKYLINYYYESLKKFLEYFDMDLEDIYPRKEYERQIKERLDTGLMLGILVLPFCFAGEGLEPKFGEETLSNMTFHLDERFTERMKGVLDDFIEWGYL